MMKKRSRQLKNVHGLVHAVLCALLVLINVTNVAGSTTATKSSATKWDEVDEVDVFHRLLYSNSTANKKHHPPPKKHDNSNHRTYDYSTTSTSSSTTNKSSANQQKASSGLVFTGMAAAAVVGVAAMYHKNRNIAVDTPHHTHPLEGAIAKRMETFQNLAGLSRPGDRGGYEDGDDSDTISYVHMEMSSSQSSHTPGANAMVVV